MTPKILLIEDEESILFIQKRILEHHHFYITDTNNGDKALKIIEDHKGTIDLVISDSNHPGMNPELLFKNIKSKYPKTKLVLLNSYYPENIQFADCVIDIPFDAKEYENKILNILQHNSESKISKLLKNKYFLLSVILLIIISSITFIYKFNQNVSDQSVFHKSETEVNDTKEKLYWINSNTNVRHNRTCRWYGNTKNGYYTKEKVGRPCGKCGG